MVEVFPVPALRDNYIWVLHDGSAAAAVDPGEAEPLIEALQTRGLRLTAILLTHHHWDHVNGAPALQKRFEVPIYGPRDSRVPGRAQALSEGETLTLDAPAVRLRVLEIPGHTETHIALYDDRYLFSGDTLFSVGCGRLFEGTPEQMLASLDKLAELPDELLVCCGHEYTVKNCQFANRVEPANEALRERLQEAQSMRERGEPTLPVSLGEERRTNPFLRCREPTVVKAASQRAGRELADPVGVFAAIRQWKDAA